MSHDLERPGADDDLVIRGEIETTERARAAALPPGQRRDGRAHLPQRRRRPRASSSCSGRVVYAHASNNPDERLGEGLLMRGQDHGAPVPSKPASAIRPGLRLGADPGGAGALEPEELIPAVEHARQGASSWSCSPGSRGEYELVIKELDARDNVAMLNMSTENLILEGIRRTRSWQPGHTRGIGATSRSCSCPPAAPDAAHQLDLTEEEQEVLAHVNGRAYRRSRSARSQLPVELRDLPHPLGPAGAGRHPARAGRRGEPRAARGPAQRERELDLEGIVEKFNQMFSRIYAFLRGRLRRRRGRLHGRLLWKRSRGNTARSSTAST